MLQGIHAERYREDACDGERGGGAPASVANRPESELKVGRIVDQEDYAKN